MCDATCTYDVDVLNLIMLSSIIPILAETDSSLPPQLHLSCKGPSNSSFLQTNSKGSNAINKQQPPFFERPKRVAFTQKQNTNSATGSSFRTPKSPSTCFFLTFHHLRFPLRCKFTIKHRAVRRSSPSQPQPQTQRSTQGHPACTEDPCHTSPSFPLRILFLPFHTPTSHTEWTALT